QSRSCRDPQSRRGRACQRQLRRAPPEAAENAGNAGSGCRRMRILLTNNSLGVRAGSELYVRDIAIELMRRGHRPVAYSTRLGAVAEELRAATVPVNDRLSALAEPPDIIHGQHHYETFTALLRFPDTPAIYYCPGWL